MYGLILSFKIIKKIYSIFADLIYNPIVKLNFYLNGVKPGRGFKSLGFPFVSVNRTGTFTVGENLKLNNGNRHNVIGRQQRCIFWVDGELIIQDNVGISSTAIVCEKSIKIGNNVKIGGNTVIYDTDFHSLDPQIRNSKSDKKSAISLSVIIEDNVFIGAHSTILKGVTIGENSIVGACSVITKNIPPNEIWAGNPAKKIKNITE
jgi:acetyltransferase-like isoleucine patch superfamily enzyme